MEGNLDGLELGMELGMLDGITLGTRLELGILEGILDGLELGMELVDGITLGMRLELGIELGMLEGAQPNLSVLTKTSCRPEGPVQNARFVTPSWMFADANVARAKLVNVPWRGVPYVYESGKIIIPNLNIKM